MAEIRLLGALGVRRVGARHVYLFSSADPPVLAVERGVGSFRITLTLDAVEVPLTVDTTVASDRALVTVRAPIEQRGAGDLTLRAPARFDRWSVMYIDDPEALPALAPARALRLGGRPEDALAALDALDPATLEPRVRFWRTFERGRALRAMGAYDRASVTWESAVADAWAAEVDSWSSRALRAAAYLAYQTRAFDRASALLDRAAAIDHALDDFDGPLATHYYRGLIATERGALRDARRHYAAALGPARAHLRPLAGHIESGLSLLHLGLGEFEEARAIAHQILDRLDDAPPDLHHQVGERLLVAWVLLQVGIRLGGLDDDRIDALVDGCIEQGALAGEPQLELTGLFNRCWKAWWRGDIARARADLDRFAARQRALTDAPGVSEAMYAREFDLLSGRILLAEGDPDGAALSFEQLRDAVGLENAGEPSPMAIGARLGLARVALARGRRAAARAHLDDGMDALARLTLDVDRRGAAAFLRERPLLCDPTALVDARVDLACEERDLSAAVRAADAPYLLRQRALDHRTVAAGLSGDARARWSALGDALDSLRRRYDNTRADVWLPPAQREARLVALASALRGTLDDRLRLLERRHHIDRAAGDLGRLRARLGGDEALVLLRRRSDGRREGWWIDAASAERAFVDDLARWLAPRARRLRHLYLVGDTRSGAWSAPTLEVDGAPLAARVGVSILRHAGGLLRCPTAADGCALVVTDPLDDLPAARRSGPVLGERLDAAVIDSRAARREAVLGALADASLFHFAGHGELDSGGGVELRLADGASLRPEDILGCLDRLPPRRVVLNGCRTAAGYADDAVSLAGAFLAAGSASVLGTVEPVGVDAATAFVERFYTSGGAERPAEALREATRWAVTLGDPIWRAYRLMGLR